MNHNANHKQESNIKKFAPLIAIFTLIIVLTVGKQMLSASWNIHSVMQDFMGFFFLVFATFKIIKLSDFAQAYAEYDIIAKQSSMYAHIYPFIELILGIVYLLHRDTLAIHIFTMLLMGISALGVAIELAKGKTIMCACLGTVFKVPMTYVTLLEDLLMALMALAMIFY